MKIHSCIRSTTKLFIAACELERKRKTFKLLYCDSFNIRRFLKFLEWKIRESFKGWQLRRLVRAINFFEVFSPGILHIFTFNFAHYVFPSNSWNIKIKISSELIKFYTLHSHIQNLPNNIHPTSVSRDGIHFHLNCDYCVVFITSQARSKEFQSTVYNVCKLL